MMRVITLLILLVAKTCMAQFRIIGVLEPSNNDEQLEKANTSSLVQLETFLEKNEEFIVPQIQSRGFSDSVLPLTVNNRAIDNTNLIKVHIMDNSLREKSEPIQENAYQINNGLEAVTVNTERTRPATKTNHYPSKFCVCVCFCVVQVVSM